MKMQNKIYNLYIYKWPKEPPNKITFNDVYFNIKNNINEFGIIGIKMTECDFWYRLRFKSEEDLMLFKLLSGIKNIKHSNLGRRSMYQYE